MDIKALQAVEFPHEAIVTEYKININKLPIPLKAKVTKATKAKQLLTEQSTEQEIEALLDHSTILAGILMDEYVDDEELVEAKKLAKEAKEGVVDAVDEDNNVDPPIISEKIKEIQVICKEKGMITIDELKKIGLKSFADTIVLSSEHSLKKDGEGYVLEGGKNKSDGTVATILAAIAGIGLVFGLSRAFRNK